MKIPLTGVQLFIVRGLRHRVVTGAIFAGHCLKRFGQPAESVSGLETQEKESWISVRYRDLIIFKCFLRETRLHPQMIGI